MIDAPDGPAPAPGGGAMKAQTGRDASAYVSRWVQDQDRKIPASEASHIAASFLAKLRRRIAQQRAAKPADAAPPSNREGAD